MEIGKAMVLVAVVVLLLSCCVFGGSVVKGNECAQQAEAMGYGGWPTRLHLGVCQV
jgi:hypothetical protein